MKSYDNDVVIKNIMSIVREKLEGEGSGHDWWHIVRVYNNAIDIAHKEGNANLFEIKLIALLHDVADHKFGYTDEDRRKIITNILENEDVDRGVIESVVYACNNMSYKSGTNTHKLETVESRIVQDADRLDAIGAIGIARTFAFGGHKGREIYNPESEKEHTMYHFYEKLLLLKDLMNTDSGREKAKQRHEFLEIYLQEFYDEWDGIK
jgi:uncharacterized protein